MAISQRLDLRQSQTLVMTPQLQQAIKLLQMSNQELSDFIAQRNRDKTPSSNAAKMVLKARRSPNMFAG